MTRIPANPFGPTGFVTLLLACFTLAPTAGAAQQPVPRAHEHPPFACDDVPAGASRPAYAVVPGSGTGALSGLRGNGSSSVGHGNEHPFVLDYDLD